MIDGQVRELLERVRSTPDFCSVTFDSINATNALGDNALHCVCADLPAAKLLVEHGIDIHQCGEFGFTPLRVAVDFGDLEIAAFLIAKGAEPAASARGQRCAAKASARRAHDARNASRPRFPHG